MDILPIPLPRALIVIAGALQHDDRLLPEMLATLALRAPVTILDGGNRLPVQPLLAFLRLHTPDPLPAARGINLRRAFTCHQVLAVLEACPAQPHPIVLLDPLLTFYDDNVPMPEAAHVLAACLRHIARLRQAAGVLAFVSPPPLPERLPLFESLCAQAAQTLELAPALPAARQPALF